MRKYITEIILVVFIIGVFGVTGKVLKDIQDANIKGTVSDIVNSKVGYLNK